MDKDKLIKAVAYKGGNITTIYYNIGRALPFIVQRFPDGYVSDWYRSQHVEVHRVEPGGVGGRFGNAYGFYFRNGIREDCHWCKKEDTEPQLIQCCGCGSWVLLNILGEPTVEPAKIYGLQDELDFGKHKGETVEEVVHSDFAWIKWAIVNSDHFLCDVEEIIEEHQKDVKALQPNDILAFGKYKGLSLKEAFDKDEKYVLWLAHNVPDVEIDFSKLITVNPNI